MAEPRPEVRPINGVIDHYVGAFSTLLDRKLTASQHVRRLEAYDATDARTVGWSFILNPEKTRVKGGVEVLMDYDDTQAPTSQHKRDFHTACTELLPLTEEQKDGFLTSISLINKVARISSDTDRGFGIGRYTPILELRGISRLLYNVANNPGYEMPQTDEATRGLIFNEVVVNKPEEWPTLPVRQAGKRLFEPDEYSLGMQYDETRPEGVYRSVWDIFKKHMAHASIAENELTNFNTPEDAWLTSLTFGSLDHQLEKVLKAMELLKDSGKRLPDEILVVTEGFKQPLVDERMKMFPGTSYVLIDDSVDQLQLLLGRDKLKLVHAKRPNTKYSHEVAPNGVETVLIENTPHSLIVAGASV